MIEETAPQSGPVGSQKRSRLGRALAAVVVGLVGGSLPALAASPAVAASPAIVHGVPGTLFLRSVACPSATICEAVGQNSSNQGVVVAITNGVHGVVQVVPGARELSGVACASATACEAVGMGTSGTQGVVVSITSGSPAPARTVPVQLFGVTCPTAATCLAVGATFATYYTQGVTIAITDGTPAAAQVVPATFELRAVACGSATICEAVGTAAAGDYDAVGVVLTNGVAGAAQAWLNTGVLLGVACPSATSCQAVGRNPRGEGFVMGIINGALYNPQVVFGVGSLWSISCPSATNCQAVGTNIIPAGIVVTVTNSTPGPATVVEDAPTLGGVACPGGTSCQAVGAGDTYEGVVITVDVTGTLPAASFTYPLDGQTTVDTFHPFTWSTVPQAQAYYLTVGTTLYGTDLLNTGVLASTQTYFNMPDLPVGPTIQATLLVEVDGAWTAHESITFTAALGKAIFTSPLDGQTGVDQTQIFKWSEFPELLGLSFPQALGYYLAVGTTPGGSDLVNVSTLPGSVSFNNSTVLPSGRPLYATLFSGVNGTWSRYQTITFTAAPAPAPSAAVFTYPVDAQTNVDTTTETGFNWTAPFSAQGYYLIVGTTLYGSDLVKSGVMSSDQNWLAMPGLPTGQTLYATLFTSFNGSWARTRSITFSAAPGMASLTYPTNGQLNVDTTKAFTWTTVAPAQAYYLVVGTIQFGADLVNSGVMPVSQLSLSMVAMPTGTTLFATLFTEVNGSWGRSQSITFRR